MRLPRFVIWAAIAVSLLLSLGFAMRMWVLWPLHTTLRFVERLSRADEESIRELMSEADWFLSEGGLRVYADTADVTFLRRSQMDVVTGRVDFVLKGKVGRFTAVRSTIHIADRESLTKLFFCENLIARCGVEIDKCNAKKAELTETRHLRARSTTETVESALEHEMKITELEVRIMQLTFAIEDCKQSLAKMIEECRTDK